MLFLNGMLGDFINANSSNFKVSECLFSTHRIKQGSQFDVILLYSYGFAFTEVQEGLK